MLCVECDDVEGVGLYGVRKANECSRPHVQVSGREGTLLIYWTSQHSDSGDFSL